MQKTHNSPAALKIFFTQQRERSDNVHTAHRSAIDRRINFDDNKSRLAEAERANGRQSSSVREKHAGAISQGKGSDLQSDAEILPTLRGDEVQRIPPRQLRLRAAALHPGNDRDEAQQRLRRHRAICVSTFWAMK